VQVLYGEWVQKYSLCGGWGAAEIFAVLAVFEKACCRDTSCGASGLGI
jgi:hypothetical protein